MTGKYQLVCLECGRTLTDSYTNRCPEGHESLLRTVYTKRLRKLTGRGIFNYIDWLPVEEALPLNSCPITYKSEDFGRELGLDNLYISFSGYLPERGAFMKTCTFKELEALPACQRAKEKCGKILVVPSAGNTARAFAEVASMTGMPVVLIVPKGYLYRIWTTTENHDSILLISVDGDYSDAIAAGKEIAKLDGLIEEGGVRNVARRDGLGVVELEAAFSMHVLPDYYFQAVGSGTGAIAAWEAFSRLIGDGRFGNKMPVMVISQNLPFAPMFSAWQARRAEIIPDRDMRDAEDAIKEMYADVLSTRNPAYSIKGGVYDMLSSTGGEIYGITNEECQSAEKLFESEEGVDLDPAAAVTVASLIRAVDEGFVGRKDKILVNITGGGYKRLMEDCNICRIEDRVVLRHSSALDEIEPELKEFLYELRSCYT